MWYSICTDSLVRMTPNQHHSPIRRLALIAISGLLFASIIYPFIGRAVYREPATNPPSYNVPLSPPQYDATLVPEIINVAGSATVYQQKSGSLLIGPADASKCDLVTVGGDRSGCSKLCLNPDLTNYRGTSDPTNCISSWRDIPPPTTGFLHRFDGTAADRATLPPYGNSGNASTALIDSGYVGWQANPSGVNTSQLFSFIAEAPPCLTLTPPCPATSGIPPSAIRAEGDASTNYAGQFLGTLGVVGAGPPDSPGAPWFCLNENTGGSCIAQWLDLAAQTNPKIVRLQNLQGNLIILDQGQTATAGTLVAETLVAGQPVFTTPPSSSCGDGICQPPTETTNACSHDCK